VAALDPEPIGPEDVVGKLDIEDVPNPFDCCVDCCCVAGGWFEVVDDGLASGFEADADGVLPGLRNDEEKLMITVLCSHLLVRFLKEEPCFVFRNSLIAILSCNQNRRVLKANI
jgi:hypothetical protein